MELHDFSREWALFEARKWSPEEQGRYCLIVDDQLELFEGAERALHAGLSKRGPGRPFFLRRVGAPSSLPHIACRLMLPGAHRDALTAAGQTAPEANAVTGVLDTGSVRTSLAGELAVRLGLIQVDLGLVSTGQGQTKWPLYWGALEIDETRLEGFFYGNTDRQLAAPIIIGMDIISRGDFVVSSSERRAEITFPPGVIFVS